MYFDRMFHLVGLMDGCHFELEDLKIPMALPNFVEVFIGGSKNRGC